MQKEQKIKDIDLLIIGGDSYIARSYIKNTKSEFRLLVISRKKTEYKNEILCDNFFNLPEEYFERSIRVINFVGIAHRLENISEKEYLHINGILPVVLARLAKKSGVRYFVQMSSISIFGRQPFINANCNPLPVTDYGRSKLFAENELEYLQDSKFHVLSIRPPMIYGPEAPGNLFRLLKIADSLFPLPLKDIYNHRDLIFIDNFVKIIDTVFKEELSGRILVSENCSVSTTFIVTELRKSLKRNLALFKLPLFARTILKLLFPIEFEKIFCDSVIDEQSVPEIIKKIKFYSPAVGLRVTAEAYYKKKRE